MYGRLILLHTFLNMYLITFNQNCNSMKKPYRLKYYDMVFFKTYGLLNFLPGLPEYYWELL